MNSAGHRLRLGIAGLGRAFTIMLPSFLQDRRIELIAAADPRADACAQFAQDFKARTYASVRELCTDAEVEAVYIATPHQLHAEHVTLAASAGKHILVEKPLGVTLDECRKMISAAAAADVRLIVGHSHSFDAPYRRAREIIASGAVGKLGMITAINCTDFIYRPRRPEELVTAQGGGVVFSQGAHQIDIVRLLGGGRVRTVRGQTGLWDAARPAEGAYAALLIFEDGAFANLVYSGYGHFDSDVFFEWIGEMGSPKDPGRYGAARRNVSEKTPMQEAELKAARNYGGSSYKGPTWGAERLHQHFGFVLACCEHADLRPTPHGVIIHEDFQERLETLPVAPIPRVEVIDELCDAVFNSRPPVHDGPWAMATLEVCLAILQSAREQREISLLHQVGLQT
jgi:phthalate 4,5-cis-dihydrodiol dehydrogenase